MEGKVRAIGVSFTTSEVTIKNAFEQCGDVVDVQLIKDPSNQSKGVAIITYENKEDAKKAVRELNDVDIDGNNVRVTLYSSNGNNNSPQSSPFNDDDDRDSDHYSSRRDDNRRSFDSPRDSRRDSHSYRRDSYNSYSRDRDRDYGYRRESNSRDRDYRDRDRNPPRRDSFRERGNRDGRDSRERDYNYEDDELEQIYNDLVKLLEQYRQHYSINE